MTSSVCEPAVGAKFSDDQKRLCGTPGCIFRDHHDGPCSNALPLAKRPRYVPPPPKAVVKAAAAAPKRARKVHAEDLLVDAAAAGVPPPVSLKPAEQAVRKDGLLRYYHVHRWGTPLPDGPVTTITGGGSDDEADDDWRRDEIARRTSRRPEVGEEEAAFMAAWNAFVASRKPRLVSDRMLPEACRRFAQAHAAALAPGGALHAPFRQHLAALWEHNLLHPDDVLDCLRLTQPAGAEEVCAECARPRHESHCALAGRVRGAAAWPSFQMPKLHSVAAEDRAAILAAAIVPGGVAGEGAPAR